MIELIPAISVMSGKVVRTQQDNFDVIRTYDEKPLEMAKKFEGSGIRRLHLIDLDGAKAGRVINYETLEMLARHTDLEIDFSGGINTDGNIRLAFESGAKMVTSGSTAVNEPNLFSDWLITYGRKKIILAADSTEGKIAVGGWLKKTEIDVIDHVKYFYDKSITYVKCTDIDKDGKLEGPAFDLYQRLLDKFEGLKLLASGGVRSVDDIRRLDEMGVHGVIFARAFYEGDIKLKDLEQFLVNA